MTREEAICELSVIWERLSHPEDCENGCYSFRDGDYIEALDMAIEALQREEAEAKGYCHRIKPKQDQISRTELFNKLATVQAPQEANEYKAEVYKIIQSMGIDAIINVMEGGDEEPGQWQTEDGRETKAEYSVYCSKCGSWSGFRTKYCGNCGSLMKEENDEKY